MNLTRFSTPTVSHGCFRQMPNNSMSYLQILLTEWERMNSGTGLESLEVLSITTEMITSPGEPLCKSGHLWHIELQSKNAMLTCSVISTISMNLRELCKVLDGGLPEPHLFVRNLTLEEFPTPRMAPADN